MAIHSSFVASSRIRLITFFICLNILFYMVLILKEDIRALFKHRLYNSKLSNFTEIEPEIYEPEGKENATFIFLARNSDLDGVLKSMRSVEKHFNERFGYPWIFLNEEEFTDEFKELVTAMTLAPVQFGVIPAHHWYQPEWIDESLAERTRQTMASEGVIYGDSVSYRNMCRFNSGYFFHHPLVQRYRYYWRIEPDVEYSCHIQYDPFEYLRENNITYGFTITLREIAETVSTLWSTVKEFMVDNPEYIAEDNAMAFLSDNGGDTYNMCHFWSNFEIADLDFWRSEAYSQFFEYLDSKGGFYYERWGDAPVHSIAASLFLKRDQLHFFNDIGYRHSSIMHCPQQPAFLTGKCTCNRVHTIDYRQHSCLMIYKRMRKG